MMLKDRVTSKERLSVPLAWKLYRLKVKFLFMFRRNARMASDKTPHDYQCVCDPCVDERNQRRGDPMWLWPFQNEEEEHRHFDNLQRVADIRGAR